jgi:hypothetical protein
MHPYGEGDGWVGEVGVVIAISLMARMEEWMSKAQNCKASPHSFGDEGGGWVYRCTTVKQNLKRVGLGWEGVGITNTAQVPQEKW